jgi:hypothetical protein
MKTADKLNHSLELLLNMNRYWASGRKQHTV